MRLWSSAVRLIGKHSGDSYNLELITKLFSGLFVYEMLDIKLKGACILAECKGASGYGSPQHNRSALCCGCWFLCRLQKWLERLRAT